MTSPSDSPKLNALDNSNGELRRFVLLYHQLPEHAARNDHWDLMLEANDDLHTWALETCPKPDTTVIGMRIANHRKAYLQREGPISGDRGSVKRVSTGTYVLQDEKPDRLTVLLQPCLHCQSNHQPCPGHPAENVRQSTTSLPIEIELRPENQRCSIRFGKSSWRAAR